MLSKGNFNVGAALEAINKRKSKMKKDKKIILALAGITLAAATFILSGVIYQLHPATITAIACIGLIICRLIWICVDGKDRGGRYGR